MLDDKLNVVITYDFNYFYIKNHIYIYMYISCLYSEMYFKFIYYTLYIYIYIYISMLHGLDALLTCSFFVE